MWVNNINPILLKLGPLQVRYYGIVYLIGALLCYYVLEKARKQGKLAITEDDSSNFVVWLMIAIIIGSRLFEVVFYSLPYYLSQPWWKVFAVWEGGLSFHGGLVGAVIAAIFFCRKKKINMLKVADILSLPIIFALALGRLANFTNGELWGTVSNARWCVVFPRAGPECRHPYQLYDGIKRFIIFAYLFIINKNEYKPGFIFWNLVFFEGLGRFILDFVKVDVHYFMLTPGQWLSMIMVGSSIYFFLKYHKEDCRKLMHIPFH